MNCPPGSPVCEVSLSFFLLYAIVESQRERQSMCVREEGLKWKRGELSGRDPPSSNEFTFKRPEIVLIWCSVMTKYYPPRHPLRVVHYKSHFLVPRSRYNWRVICELVSYRGRDRISHQTCNGSFALPEASSSWRRLPFTHK